MSFAPSDRHALLAALHPAGFRDLRAKSRDGVWKTRGVDAADLDGVDRFAAMWCEWDLYVGVATRGEIAGRTADDCESLYALFADVDFKDTSEADARQRVRDFALPPSAVVASGGGLHLYWFLDKPLDLRDGGTAAAKQLLRSLAVAIGADTKAAEPARILRLPGSLNHKYPPPRTVTVESLTTRRYAVADIVAHLPPPDGNAESAAPELPRVVGDGDRNNTLFREGCRLRRLGWDEAEIATSLAMLNRRRCHPALEAAEVEAIAHSCARYPPSDDIFPTTETGDAEFFAACNADTVRYDHRRGRWLLFTDHVWVPQINGEIDRLALDAIRARQLAAAKSTGDGRAKRIKWAVDGEARKRLGNLLALAKTQHPLADSGEQWDLDPWLVGAPNGVIDLRTGALRPGRAEDRITMRVRSAFDPAATCPLYDKTVDEIFEGKADLVAYFDRYIGYSLTGDCREESLAFCWGAGANGKGTLLNTIGWLLGDYADDLPFSAFELQNRSGVPNDIAKIVNKRFITASETGETQRLNEARVKALTGRDPITARFLHKEFFTFQPVAKFWLATNHKPEVHDDSEGFWRRLHLIPFAASFVGKEDKTLKDRLRDEAPGILARVVRGGLAWQREGLNAPEIVRAATKTYRDNSMPLARFFDECCVIETSASATFSELFGLYVGWSGRGARMGRGAFREALLQRFETNANETTRHQHLPVLFLGVGMNPQLKLEIK